MADEQLTLADAAGTKYEFWLHKIGANYINEPGVYAFIRDDTKAWSVIYIGETDDLGDRLTARLKQHHRYDCIVNQECATHLLTYQTDGTEKARLDLETRLRNHYDPPCNRQ